MTKLLQRFLRAREGSAALEFAFVMPVMITLIAGTIEFATITFATSLLEGGIREAARFGITGQGSTQEEREAQILSYLNEHSAGLYTIQSDEIETLVYPSFAEVGQAEPYTDTNGNGQYDSGEDFTDRNCNDEWDEDMGLSGAGAGDEVVLYTVTHEFPTVTGILDLVIGHDGVIPLSASVVVRNEPFPGGTETCPET